MHLSSGDRFYLKICALIISDGEKIVKICQQKPKILGLPPKKKLVQFFGTLCILWTTSGRRALTLEAVKLYRIFQKRSPFHI